MLRHKEILDWQKALHCSGAELGMPELLRYKNSKLSLPVKKQRGTSSQSGQYLSHHRGRGMEFDEVRPYQAGDDIRSIDWRVTARTGKAHTKLYREEKERPVFICTDFSTSMYFGTQLMFKSVQAAHITAALAWGAVNKGDRVGGLVFTDTVHRELKPAARKQGALHLLNTMVNLHQDTSENPVEQQLEPNNRMNEHLQRLTKLIKPGTEVVLISDFHQLNDRSIELIRGISRHSPVTAINIYDPFERELTASSGDLPVTDGNESWSLYPENRQFRDKYKENSAAAQEYQQSMLTKSRVNMISISAALPLNLQWQR